MLRSSDKAIRTITAAGSALLIVAACGGSSNDGDAATAACKRLAAATSATNCAALPPAEVGRRNGALVTVCKNLIALPGASVTVAWVNGCATAYEQMGCPAVASSACQSPSGTLSGGAACAAGTQCLSDSCQATTGTVAPCGTCDALVALGQPCGAGRSCGRDAECNGTLQTCQPLPGAGASCSTVGCKSGLSCLQNQTCGVTLEATIGASCNNASDCASLTCDPSTLTCKSPQWAAAGMPCDAATLCIVGFCNNGVCPMVLADGALCDSTTGAMGTCDTFSSCTRGVCRPLFSVQCK